LNSIWFLIHTQWNLLLRLMVKITLVVLNKHFYIKVWFIKYYLLYCIIIKNIDYEKRKTIITKG